MGAKSWQLGSPGTLTYRLYDALRNQLNGKLVNYLLARAINHDKCKVLEAGSGPAFASSILAQDRRVGLSVAVDLDIEALHEARRRDPNLCLVVADLRNLPFRAESMDLSWNSSTVEHLPNPSCCGGRDGTCHPKGRERLRRASLISTGRWDLSI